MHRLGGGPRTGPVQCDEIFVADADGITRGVLATCDQLYGLRETDILGRHVTDLEREGIFSPSVTQKVLETRRPQTLVQLTIRGRRLVVTGYPIFDQTGKIAWVVSIGRDITEANHFEPSGSHRQQGCDPPVASSEAMQQVLRLLERVAVTDCTVLLLGETGTGKTMLARYLHQLSRRARRPLVEINCAAIPPALVESELFGYEGGAFTGARRQGKPGLITAANGGTLFLDEIGELSLEVQAKLLHLIEAREFTPVGAVRPVRVDIRIVAATNQDLPSLVRAGRFRKDLYYRLNVISVRVPPLRERRTDIPPLATYLLCQLNQRYGRNCRLSPAAMAALLTYAWPGNVRELYNALERTVVTTDHTTIEPEDLPAEIRWGSLVDPDAASDDESLSLNWYAAREALERKLLIEASRRASSTHEMARLLGITQSAVVKKLRRYGLPGPQGTGQR